MEGQQFLRRYAALGETFSLPIILHPSLRVNTLKTSPAALQKRLAKESVILKKIPFLTNGYYYTAPFSLGATTEYLLGHYYLQEAAAQLPAELLNPSPTDYVLDMAASPGGKTTQLAQRMRNEGIIIALDTGRLDALRNNLERLSVKNVLVYRKDARFAKDLGMQFDKILLDAPCSGNFCTHPNYFKEKTLPGIQERSRLQKELLKAAHTVLKARGILVYSTCSLEPEENELVIDWFLNKYQDMTLEETTSKIGDPGFTTVFGTALNPALAKTRRFWPHKHGTEGFFIAKLIKA
ncbi:MAG: RsmB/NOP family class I SAM-dependent RNA methyltransferase [archaeon]